MLYIMGVWNSSCWCKGPVDHQENRRNELEWLGKGGFVLPFPAISPGRLIPKVGAGARNTRAMGSTPSPDFQHCSAALRAFATCCLYARPAGLYGLAGAFPAFFISHRFQTALSADYATLPANLG